MTKEQYFEMCEMLGEEPLDENIPVEFDDMVYEAQQAMLIYRKLRDEWEGMSGTYMGKSYAGLIDILDISEVPKEDRKWLLELLEIIDSIRSEEIQKKQKASKKEKPT